MTTVKPAWLTRAALRRLAGERAFERGEDYAAGGHVISIAESEGRITAQVRGAQTYRVILCAGERGLEHSCTCPVGDDGICCKHCVAAGLVWMEKGTDTRQRKRKATRPQLTMKDVRAHLGAKSREELVALAMEHAATDDELRQRLLLEAARSAAHGVNVETYRQAIDAAADTGDFVDYREAYGYAERLDRVIDSLEALLPHGHGNIVRQLSEYALRAIERAIGSVDDSDGALGQLLVRLQEIHLAACKATRPDAAELARVLFEWELHGEWDVFHGAAKTYARILGKAGLAVYRECAEALWKEVPAVGPGEKDPIGFSARFRITHIMETLAGQAGDRDALIAIKERDLSHTLSYLEIAELYEQRKAHDTAVEWAERGVAAFPRHTDPRLLEFLANAYRRAGRQDDAMAVVWRSFEESSHHDRYRDLERHARASGQWPAWRAKALAVMREAASARNPAEDRRRSAWGRPADRSELVRAFLGERDLDAAWREAEAGGCTPELWLTLARKRESAHPEDSIRVFQQLVELALARKNKEAYREAVGLLRDVGRVLAGIGRREDFAPYVDSVRKKHKAKRNFVKMVDGARFWGSVRGT